MQCPPISHPYYTFGGTKAVELSPPRKIKIVMAYLRTILRDMSQTGGYILLRSSSPMVNPNKQTNPTEGFFCLQQIFPPLSVLFRLQVTLHWKRNESYHPHSPMRLSKNKWLRIYEFRAAHIHKLFFLKNKLRKHYLLFWKVNLRKKNCLHYPKLAPLIANWKL